MIPNSHQVTKLLPFGVIDQDSRPELVSVSDYLHARNMRMGPPDSGKDGVQDRVEGNQIVPLPSNTSRLVPTAIGAFLDKARNDVYYWNITDIEEVIIGGGTRTIRTLTIFRHNIDTNDVEELFQSKDIPPPDGTKINSAVIVGGRYLVWTTSKPDADVFIGDAPRWIDLKSTKEVEKEYQVYIWSEDYAGSYRIKLTDADGGDILTSNGLIIGDTREEALEYLRSRFEGFNLNVPDANVQVGRLITIDGNPLFKVKLAAGYRLELQPGTEQGNALVACNDYLDDVASRATDLVRWPPRYAPLATYRSDPDYQYDFVTSKPFQFRLQYVYFDDSVSAWGPISKVASPTDDSGFVPDRVNSVRVNFNDDQLVGTDLRSILKSVNVAFREGNSGLFRLITNVSVSSLERGDQYLDFYNDKSYPVIGSDATGAAADTQALKLFDSVPRGAVSIADVVDEDGNAILALGGLLEGGDIADTSVDYKIESTPPDGGGDVGECDITIRGSIRVNFTAFQQQYFSSNNNRRFESAVHDLDGSASGFVCYLAGTELFGISDSFQVSPTGVFQITNVPKGKFVLRVASPLCRFDDTQGELFNITRGRNYQLTSAPVIDVAGGDNYFERIIDLTDFNGNVFDLDVEAGYGEVVVQSFNREEGEFDVLFNEFYLRDNVNFERVGSDWQFAEAQDFLESMSVPGRVMEMVWITENIDPRFGQNVYNIESTVSDHNGFCYCIFEAPDYNDNHRYETSGAGRIVSYNPCNSNQLTNSSLIHATGGLGNRNAWKDLYEGNAFVVDGGSVTQWFVGPLQTVVSVIEDSDFRENYLKTISGNVSGASGPVPDVSVVLSSEGRIGVTDANGDYSIDTFLLQTDFNAAPSNPQSRRFIVPNNVLDRCYESPFDPESFGPVSIDFCAIGDFVAGFVHDFSGSTTGGGGGVGVSGNGVVLFGKSGGRYRTGIVYEDRANRKGEVREGPEIYIPFHTEDGLGYIQRYVNFEVVGVPPVWATHYRLLRSRNGVQATFQQRIVSDARYVEIQSTTTAPQTRQFGAAGITHVMLRLDGTSVPEVDGSGLALFFQDSEGNTVSAVKGDRVRLILDAAQNTVVNDRILESEVVAEYVDPADPNSYYLVLDAEPLEDVEIDTGFLVEVYTPRSNRPEDDFLFETGDAFPIIDAGLETRRHGANSSNQSTDASMAAKGFLTGGDTFWRRRIYPVTNGNVSYSFITENWTLTDDTSVRAENVGRPNPLGGVPERFYYWMIRTSSTFIQNGLGAIVGINSFLSGDRQNVDPNFGPITKLIMSGQRMVCVCRHKIQTIYVAHEAVMDMSGNQLIGRTDRLLTIAPETVSPLGSQHPHSIVNGRSGVYGFDLERGKVWRYGQNGVQSITKGKTNFFHGLRASEPDDQHFPAVYDYTHAEYLISTSEGVQVFRPDRKGWTSDYLFFPEMMVAGARDYYSFNEGNPYLHNVEGSTVFYDDEISSYIHFVSSLEAVDFDKLLHNVRLASSSDLSIDPIRVHSRPLDSSEPLMISRLSNKRFGLRRGHVFEAAFLRDMSDSRFDDPVVALFRGAKLHGQYVELVVNCSRIAMLELEWTPLMDSNQ